MFMDAAICPGYSVYLKPFVALKSAHCVSARSRACGSLVIFSEQGTVERVYTHPGALFGCDWCPGHVDIIATGCQDRNVRVFDVSSAAGSEPKYLLSGHLERVFHVCWCVVCLGFTTIPGVFFTRVRAGQLERLHIRSLSFS